MSTESTDMINLRDTSVNSFEIVKQMSTVTQKPFEVVKKHYVVFLFGDGKLLKVHLTSQDPNVYSLAQQKKECFSDIELRYSFLSFDILPEAIDCATNIMLDCQPPFNNRLPDGHNYLHRPKIMQHYYAENDEIDTLFEKYGVEFGGHKWICNDVLLKVFASDRIKLPLHETPFWRRIEFEERLERIQGKL